MDNLINELYYGNLCPVEQMGRPTPEEKEVLKRIHESYVRFSMSRREQSLAQLKTTVSMRRAPWVKDVSVRRSTWEQS